MSNFIQVAKTRFGALHKHRNKKNHIRRLKVFINCLYNNFAGFPIMISKYKKKSSASKINFAVECKLNENNPWYSYE